MSEQIEGCPQPETPIRERAWTAGQPEDSRCPTTYRREGAVKTLIGLGWKWDGQQWQAEQAGGVVSEEANWNPRGVTGPPIADGLLRNGSVAALLDRAAIAMPVLRNTLNAAGLKGGAIADELLADIQAVAPSLRAPAEQGGRVDTAMTLEDRVEFALRDAGFGLDEASRIAALAQNAQGEAGMDFQTCVAVEVGADESDQDDILRHLTAWMKVARDANHAERARVPDVLGSWRIVAEAAEVLQMTANSGAKLPANWRWPLLDELSGIAYMMKEAAAPSQPEDAA